LPWLSNCVYISLPSVAVRLWGVATGNLENLFDFIPRRWGVIVGLRIDFAEFLLDYCFLMESSRFYLKSEGLSIPETSLLWGLVEVEKLYFGFSGYTMAVWLVVCTILSSSSLSYSRIFPRVLLENLI
jgi:hypothetical protein